MKRHRQVMDPQRFEHRLQFERIKPGATRDANGEIDKTIKSNWEVYATAYAEVLGKGRREVYRAQQTFPEASHVVNCPYDSGIADAKPEHRIRWGDQILHPKAKPENVGGANQELKFICGETT